MTSSSEPLGDDVRGALAAVFERARALGFIGPGPSTDDHIDHALGFARAWPGPLTGPRRALDLGSGAGLPGLVLAMWWSTSVWVLLDANLRRTAALEDAVRELGVQGRVTVVRGRAEIAAHDPALRGGFDLVTSRSFGPPAVVAECGAGFLAHGGALVVSEPPMVDDTDRWPAGGLASVGLTALPRQHPGYRAFELAQILPDTLPRRVGVPAKRPLFS